MYKIKVITALLFIVIIINGCKHKGQTSGPEAIPVKISVMSATSSGVGHNYVGLVEESFATTLSFETAGNVQHVYVKESSRVAKGDLIATLNESTAQNAYNAAKATLERAQDGLHRAEPLYKNGSLAEIKWVEIQTALIQAQSMADISKKNLQDCKMYAPISGVISSLDLEQGMNVIPYQPLAKLVDINKLCVKVSIPENEIASMNIGQNAEIIVSALDNAVFTGKIIEKGVQADFLSHCYPVKIELDNPGKNLLPGMVCKVLIATADSLQSGFQVPVSTVQLSNDGKRFVWVSEKGRAGRRFITIGDLTNQNVIISSGLKQADSVITEGWQKLSEGCKLINK